MPELPGASVVLRNVPWSLYQAVRRDEANNHLRMIFCDGALEILSPLKQHGRIAMILDRMIFLWTWAKGIEIESGRDLTCDRKDLQKGLEPDLCYWIANQPAVHGEDEVDFRTDPPPGLALEVEITRASLPKLPIYAALGVPEVWCWRKGLQVLILQRGQFVPAPESRALAGFPLRLAEELIEQRQVLGENALLEAFEKRAGARGSA